MKTFLVVLVVLLAAYAFGPSLFQGELRIYGTKTPSEPASQIFKDAHQAAQSLEPAPAVYGPDGASPIFPEAKPRPASPKRAEDPKTARSGRPVPTPPNCYGPVCYYDSPEMRALAPMATQ